VKVIWELKVWMAKCLEWFPDEDEDDDDDFLFRRAWVGVGGGQHGRWRRHSLPFTRQWETVHINQ
jgi:hypothetical protein